MTVTHGLEKLQIKDMSSLVPPQRTYLLLKLSQLIELVAKDLYSGREAAEGKDKEFI